MRKTILILIVIFFTLTTSAQSLLPMPEWTEEVAMVEGRIVGYEKDMDWMAVVKRRNLIFDITAPVASARVADDGTFRVEIPIGTTHLKESLQLGEYDFDLVLTAGETVGITLDLNDNSAVITGPMAALNNELQHDDVCDMANNRYSLHICESGERPQTLQEFFRNAREWRDRNLTAIDSLDVQPQTKEWLRIEVRGNAMADMLGATDFVDEDWGDGSLLRTAIDTTLTRSMRLFYSSQAKTITNHLQFIRPQDENFVLDLLGGESGVIQDGLRCLNFALLLQQEKPFGDNEMLALDSLENKTIRNYFLRRNEALKAELASRQSSATNVRLHDSPTDENILDAITKQFSGSVILIDLWATWCIPCRYAISQFKPHHELLTGQGLVTIYLTDTSSPEQEWRNTAKGMPCRPLRRSNHADRVAQSPPSQRPRRNAGLRLPREELHRARLRSPPDGNVQGDDEIKKKTMAQETNIEVINGNEDTSVY